MKAKTVLVALALVVVSCGTSGKTIGCAPSQSAVVNEPSAPDRTAKHPSAAGSSADRALSTGQPSCTGMQGNECQGKSCCSSLEVPGGKFPMGRGTGTDACPKGMECEDGDQPEHEATVSTFYLDEFEVTVGRFRSFVAAYQRPNAGAGAHPKIPNSGWQAQWDADLPKTADDLKSDLKCDEDFQTWRDVPGETEQHPINCVNWYMAFAFCAWDSGRLPTDAEWEYAAAGGDENRLYPWGSAPPDKTRGAFDCLLHSPAPGGGCEFSSIAKVGSFPAGQGRWGHKDLTGNMPEWVLDVYNEEWYGTGGKTCNDCAYLVNDPNVEYPPHRVLRGGSFESKTSHLLVATRLNHVAPTSNVSGVGFRCARSR